MTDARAPGPGSWLRVAAAEAGYADRVACDVMRVARTAEGRALLVRLRASGRAVLVEPPDGARRPAAWVRLHAAPLGGADATIGFDPADWPNEIHPKVASSQTLLFSLLRGALDALEGAPGLPLGGLVEAAGAAGGHGRV